LRRTGDFLDFVRGADLLFCNADEATVLAGPGSPESQAQALGRVARDVVVKRGPAGALWWRRHGVLRLSEGARVPVLDSTGAGDAFAAGLLTAWLSGSSPEAALAAGARLGAAAVSRVGARPI
jgi:sugar/nucleoside kinase (ribokinase family)